jgi:trimethylamine corrinoid protein
LTWSDHSISNRDTGENGIAKGLRRVGERFERGEAFLTDLVGAAAAAKEALDSILRPAMAKARTTQRSLGKVVLGTVSGDIHDIGKNIVAAMLFASGFEVVDLGTDVSIDDFVSRSSEVGAKIVGTSALLSTTLPVQREIINEFVKRKIRDQHKLLVGGAPATEQWAKEIKADGYAPNAVDAVKLAKSVLAWLHEASLMLRNTEKPIVYAAAGSDGAKYLLAMAAAVA